MANIVTELRELSNGELATRRRDLKEESLNLRVQRELGQLENPAQIRKNRREVAVIETLLSERRLQVVSESAE
ncbi:50S ribosomal protein L29 [Verrucomicrobiales bacterium]|jgi:large subunit ribosomal protein L29|nr:50S ribosomal protein L29 [Verrucomicrobiales bacterium]MDB4657386.1 50S ribosomal protein L29 [Verrucomicrobiales bacterium]MDC0291820.1 50S ribosomal protein L29 [Verrucomicrobiales bacterium]